MQKVIVPNLKRYFLFLGKFMECWERSRRNRQFKLYGRPYIFIWLIDDEFD
jgi:hypothetical protein